MQNNTTDLTFTADMLIRLNIPLARCGDFSKDIIAALKTIGEFSHHDRIQIVAIHNNMTYSIQHEWYDRQLNPVPEKLEQCRILYDIPLGRQLTFFDHIMIHDTDEEINPAIKEQLQKQECRQMLLLPLFESGAQFAFIAFMQCKETHNWTTEEINLLANLASVIAIQIDNHRLLNNLKRHLQQRESKKSIHPIPEKQFDYARRQ